MPGLQTGEESDLRSRAGEAESLSGRFGVCRRIGERDLQEVHDLAVDRPAVSLRLRGKAFVKFDWEPDGDALLVIHATTVVA